MEIGMNRVVAVLINSTNPPVMSNCKVSVQDSSVVLTDDTGSGNFIQKGTFDAVLHAHPEILESIPSDGNCRLVTMCSESTVIPTKIISEMCKAIAVKRFPKELEGPIPVSIGFVREDDVEDFLSLEDQSTPMLELVDAFDPAELVDLIDCGLMKLKRIKDSVFVLRIGDTVFFEWIVVPGVDTVPQSASPVNLGAPQKLVYVLRQLPQLTPTIARKFCAQSSIFRLIADSFADVPTIWAFSIGCNIKFRTNAALLKLANILSESGDKNLKTKRSNMYIKVSDEELTDAASEASAILTPEEQAEYDFLKQAVGEYSTMEGANTGVNENREPEPTQKQAHRKHRNNEDDPWESEPREDDDEREARAARIAERKLRESLTNLKEEEEEEEPPRGEIPEFNYGLSKEEEEEEEEEEEDVYELFEEEEDGAVDKPDLIRKRDEAERRRREEARAAKQAEELAKREREEALHRREEEEANELREKIARYRTMRKEKDTKKTLKKSKSSKDLSSRKSSRVGSSRLTGGSSVSKHERLAARLDKLKEKQARLEEEDESEEVAKGEKKMSAYAKRDMKYTKLKLLIHRAQKMAADPKATLEEMQAIDDDILTAADEAEQFREESKTEIEYLRGLLKYKLAEHKRNERDIKDLRCVYLEKHVANQHARDRQAAQKKKAAVKKPTDYSMAAEYLEKKIKALRIEIERLSHQNPLIHNDL